MSQNSESDACKFDQVYKDECRYIYQRRRQSACYHEPSEQELEDLKQNLIGLALSGGGIRSATTCLGMLQAFSEMGLLLMVDYLSTVSGGGYIGSCLSALLSVNKNSVKTPGKPQQHHFKGRNDALFTTEWEKFPFRTQGNEGKYGELTGEAEIKHLRTHGNFLMARHGLFARETMRSMGNLLTGIAYHFSIILLFLFLVSAFYMSILLLFAPGIEKVLGQPPVPTTTTTQTRVETSPQPDGAITSIVEKRTVVRDPTLWESLQQQGRILHDSVQQLGKTPWPFTWALVLGLGLSIVAFCWMLGIWKDMADKQARLPIESAEPGESAEDRFECKLLWKIGGVTIILALVGITVIRCIFASSSSNSGPVLWLFLPLAVFVGAWLAGICISAVLPYGTLRTPNTLLWTRNFRSLWGSFQAITLYGVIFSLATACFPFLIYTLVTQRTLGVATHLGGPLLSLLASRVLAKRLAEIPDEKKMLPPGLMRFALGIVVGLFLLFVMLQFCILLALLPWWICFVCACIACVVCCLIGYGVDFNKLALHYFYRDRLAETYLRTEVDNGKGQMELRFDTMEMPLTHLHGTAADSNKSAQDWTPAERLWGCTAPYHLLNAAINLAGSRDLTRKDRKSGYFLFSKLYCGSAQTDYRPTAQYRRGESKLALAATISGAAAAAAMGYSTFFAQAFTMTLFNLRLGYWMENPRYPKSLQRQEGGVFWPKYLRREMLTKTGSRRRLVNLSDGGHTGDNVGICPLLERRCKVIIACDAECDPALTFGSFTKALRQAYIDWGIDVDIDLSMLRRDARTGYSRSHCAIGRIYYPDRPEQKSWLIYLKNSLTGDEPDPVKNYTAEHPVFPHETTADQFFDDDQFESYRALGVHIAKHTFCNWVTLNEFKDLQMRHSPFLSGVAQKDEDAMWAYLLFLHSPFKASDSPEFQRTTDTFVRLEQMFLTDSDLRDYYAECYLQNAPTELSEHMLGTIGPKIAHVWMIQMQLMEQVFFALRLDRYANALDNRGWMNLFRRWGNALTFKKQFDERQTTFSSDFVAFYNRYIKDCKPIEAAPIPHPWNFLDYTSHSWDSLGHTGIFLDPGRK